MKNKKGQSTSFFIKLAIGLAILGIILVFLTSFFPSIFKQTKKMIECENAGLTTLGKKGICYANGCPEGFEAVPGGIGGFGCNQTATSTCCVPSEESTTT